MLPNAEANQIYDTLISWLHANGRTDLAGEISKEIAAGRRVSRKISVPTDSRTAVDPITGEKVRGGKVSADFVGRDPFTSNQKLNLLIDALELSFGAPPLMAQKVLDTINSDNGTAELIIIREDQPSNLLRVSAKDVAVTAPSVQQVRELLGRLREQTHDVT